MARRLEFMDGFDKWTGIDYHMEAADYAAFEYKTCPWLMHNYLGRENPVASQRGESAFGGGEEDREAIRSLNAIGEGIDGSRALAIVNTSVNFDLTMPFARDQLGSRYSGGTENSPLIYGAAFGLHIKFPDLDKAFLRGYGGAICSVMVGGGSTSRQIGMQQLVFKYNHVDDNVYVNYHGSVGTAPANLYPSLLYGKQIAGTIGTFEIYGIVNDPSDGGIWVGTNDGGIPQTVIKYDWHTLDPDVLTTKSIAWDGDIGKQRSFTRDDEYYYTLTNDGTGAFNAHNVYRYDSNWDIDTTFPLDSFGMTEPVGVAYDPTNDEFYVLDYKGGIVYQVYVFNKTFSSLLASSATFNSANGVASYTDICADMSQEHGENEIPYGFPTRMDRMLLVQSAGTFAGMSAITKRLTNRPLEHSPVPSLYTNKVEDDFNTLQGGRKAFHDGFYLWQAGRSSNSSTGPIEIQRTNPQGLAIWDDNICVPTNSKAPIALADEASYFISTWFNEAQFNSDGGGLGIYVNGVDMVTENNLVEQWDLDLGTTSTYGITQISIKMGNYQPRIGTVAYLDDFWCMTSDAANEDWIDPAIMTEWKIHTLEPKYALGTTEPVNASRLGGFKQTFNSARTLDGYNYYPLGAVGVIGMEAVPTITGEVVAVSVNNNATMDDLDPSVSNYSAHGIRLDIGCGYQGAPLDYQVRRIYGYPAESDNFRDHQYASYPYTYQDGQTAETFNSQRHYLTWYDVHPQTDLPWTQADLERLQIQFEVRTSV